ncbi:hypothetical protein [Mycobacterium sp. 050134]|uniref:hypothetical protein n=1 Tax=Mycobacterium sp. 050134 TaxID=3096111 RepID=UPI002EDB5F5B
MTKIALGAAIAVSLLIGGAAPAAADPSAFGTLGCNCRTAAAGGTPARQGVDRGIADGLAAVATRPH